MQDMATSNGTLSIYLPSFFRDWHIRLAVPHSLAVTSRPLLIRTITAHEMRNFLVQGKTGPVFFSVASISLTADEPRSCAYLPALGCFETCVYNTASICTVHRDLCRRHVLFAWEEW